ncbi:hypothetical protein C8R43DRAFT_949452 [Mycena crocata]|nr:hypothetical protein C8R43DRAFT_949452 [Mycena crocata]
MPIFKPERPVAIERAITVYNADGRPIPSDFELDLKTVVYDEEGYPIPVLMTQEQILMMMNGGRRTSDLQCGERYEDMDFTFYSTILAAVDASYTLDNISYDQVCTGNCKCGCRIDENLQGGSVGVLTMFEQTKLNGWKEVERKKRDGNEPWKQIVLPDLMNDENNQKKRIKRYCHGSTYHRATGVTGTHLHEYLQFHAEGGENCSKEKDDGSRLEARMSSVNALARLATFGGLSNEDRDCDTDFSEGNYSDTDLHTDDSDSDCDMPVGGGSERTISDIDRDYEADGQCDVCRIPLGPHIDAEARAFRCFNCELGIQCESCCAELHLGQIESQHIIQEWESTNRAWGERKSLSEMEWAYGLVKNCGSCSMEIAPANCPMPPGTVMCDPCGTMLLCEHCLVSRHRMHPLHCINIWDDGWEESTLGAEGFVYQLGHSGRPCLSPEEPARPLLVIDVEGSQTVRVKFCGCGKYDEGQAGDWKQILDNGWFHSALVHPGVCATFKVLEEPEDFVRRSVHWM